MGDIDLFQTEIQVIEKARQTLGRRGAGPEPSAQDYRWLLEKYVRLFKQSRRLIQFSDRMQNELNRLNRRLHRSEAKYRNIFENATEGIFRSDPHGALLEVNPAMARILGYDHPEEVVHPKSGQWGLEAQKGYRTLLDILRQTGECRRYQTDLVLKNGDMIWVEFSAQVFRGESETMTHIDGLLSDITEKRQLQEELTRLAHTDELTGLLNRRRFTQRLQQEISRARRHDRPLSLIMMDVDFFKSVNDRFGHDTGDLVLQKVAGACARALRQHDIFGRLGGEEFAVILPDVAGTEAEQVAERVRTIVESEPIRAGRDPIQITVSIGLCELCHELEGFEALLKAADTALYRAKNNGRNRVCVHCP
jgi:diguanylate cyclase (GGDEF)-like protein/PAS domain S-box-containing protein